MSLLFTADIQMVDVNEEELVREGSLKWRRADLCWGDIVQDAETDGNVCVLDVRISIPGVAGDNRAAWEEFRAIRN